jgi:transcriptional regulator NrdR family protein
MPIISHRIPEKEAPPCGLAICHKKWYNTETKILLIRRSFMMKVLKRTGNLEDFNLEKVKISIKGAAEDFKEPLTESDLNFIAAQVEKGIFGKHQNQVSYRDIHFLVVDVLKLVGFPNIALGYDQSGLSHVRESAAGSQ